MEQVFISYTSHDLQRASAIRKMLVEHNISCWMGDKNIHASNTYTTDITKAIEQCQVFVLVLSSYSQESSYVLSEFECAIAKRKPIIPFIIENFRIKEEFHFHIRQRQAINAFEDWKESMSELLKTVRHLITKKTDEQRIFDNSQWSLLKNDACDITDKIIKCPYCGCPVLKKRRLFVDRFLYPEEGIREEEKKQMFFLRNRRRLLTVITLISLFESILAFMVFLYVLTTEADSTILFGIHFVASAVITYTLIKWCECNNVTKELMDAMKLSELKYYTFKCADCEESFSILLKEDELNNRIPGLLKRPMTE